MTQTGSRSVLSSAFFSRLLIRLPLEERERAVLAPSRSYRRTCAGSRLRSVAAPISSPSSWEPAARGHQRWAHPRSLHSCALLARVREAAASAFLNRTVDILES